MTSTSHHIDQSVKYGGLWTREKLNILEKYLNAYTKALKDQSFKLMYIDAFAGNGRVELPSDDEDGDVSGSAERAIKIEDKPFDKLIFIEKDQNQCAHLECLRTKYPNRNITVIRSEANDYLHNFHKDWRSWRGVLFLDPFATEVRWSTIKTIADFKALDTWILFPTSAIARMLPISKDPSDIMPEWAKRLTTVYGDTSWKCLYRKSQQMELFGESLDVERESGINGLISTYKSNLAQLLGDRFLTKSRTLKNSRNSPLFEFLFFVGNPKGSKVAKRIAKHIIENL